MTTLRKRAVRALAVGATTIALASALAPPATAHDYTKVHKGYAPPGTVLTEGSPESVGLIREPIEAARHKVRAHQEIAPGATYPLYPGAVGVMGHDGVIVAREASGWAVMWASDTEVLPESERTPMREDTIFDLASVSKLFTSLVAVHSRSPSRGPRTGGGAAFDGERSPEAFVADGWVATDH